MEDMTLNGIELPEVPEQDSGDRGVTPGQLVLKRFLRNRLAIVGLVVLVLMTCFAFFGPYFSPYGEYELFYEENGVEVTDIKDFNFNAPGVKLYSRASPSLRHPFGTDADGRDVLTRLMYGGRISLRIGFIVVLIELSLGVIMGGIAGYYGKWVDNLIMRLVEIFFCLPTLPIMLILSAMMLALKVPQTVKIYYLMGLLGILGWAGIARIVRGQILALREQEFMVAAEATGLSPARRIFKHLVPNVMPQLIVIATLELGGIILTESALSFLGIGLSYPYASWGNMVQAVTDPIILRKFTHIWVPPGMFILMTVLAFNFVGDGLRDAFDPKMKR